MNFKKTKVVKFQTSQYESVELFATVEVDPIADEDDLLALGLNPKDATVIMDFIDNRIREFLLPDVEEVASISTNCKSSVDAWLDYNTK